MTASAVLSASSQKSLLDVIAGQKKQVAQKARTHGLLTAGLALASAVLFVVCPPVGILAAAGPVAAALALFGGALMAGDAAISRNLRQAADDAGKEGLPGKLAKKADRLGKLARGADAVSTAAAFTIAGALFAGLLFPPIAPLAAVVVNAAIWPMALASLVNSTAGHAGQAASVTSLAAGAAGAVGAAGAAARGQAPEAKAPEAKAPAGAPSSPPAPASAPALASAPAIRADFTGALSGAAPAENPPANDAAPAPKKERRPLNARLISNEQAGGLLTGPPACLASYSPGPDYSDPIDLKNNNCHNPIFNIQSLGNKITAGDSPVRNAASRFNAAARDFLRLLRKSPASVRQNAGPGFNPSPQPGAPSKLTEFCKAVQTGDVAAASRLALNEEVAPDAIRAGLREFLTLHKIYDGLDILAEKGGIRQPGYASGSFVSDVLRGAVTNKDHLACIRFLNRQGVRYAPEDLNHALWGGQNDACREMIRSGGFDAGAGNSVALLYAATIENKEIFLELVKHGADPRAAMIHGPTENPGWDRGYKNLADWGSQAYTEEMTRLAQQKRTELYPHLRVAQPPAPAQALTTTSARIDLTRYAPKGCG